MYQSVMPEIAPDEVYMTCDTCRCFRQPLVVSLILQILQIFQNWREREWNQKALNLNVILVICEWVTQFMVFCNKHVKSSKQTIWAQQTLCIKFMEDQEVCIINHLSACIGNMSDILMEYLLKVAYFFLHFKVRCIMGEELFLEI